MEIIPLTKSLSRQWRRRGYSRLSPTRRSLKTARFGGNLKRSWKVRVARKLRLVRLVSPLKLWHRFKNAYMNMMLRLANGSHMANSGNLFGEKRIPKARDLDVNYSRSEFENRLILEIYKSMVASLELGYNK
ncbi:hypothetical protein F511_41551 [Dorcoceras hygrometricum]|uniref:Uncharacterized protein n=1 Tax=Dorcoceras hygrometricum TaxID=472368 RepID=A0A2Z7AF35_9LAMI|nr:hypothetical protein F511_41551 [Dorcoceras hygrometricum]